MTIFTPTQNYDHISINTFICICKDSNEKESTLFNTVIFPQGYYVPYKVNLRQIVFVFFYL